MKKGRVSYTISEKNGFPFYEIAEGAIFGNESNEEFSYDVKTMSK